MKTFKILFLIMAVFAAYNVHAQVAITTDGSNANASAMLEVKSTVKGFLPPRMTETQRDAITAVEGLIVFNTSTHTLNCYNGSVWISFKGTTNQTLEVGDNYQGGIVAYILQPGDPGYNAGVQHGIIAAPSDQGVGLLWDQVIPNTPVGGTLTALGTGYANTILIVAHEGVGNYAAGVCAELVLGGYSDWYLPSADELNKLYISKDVVGSYANKSYFSSSEATLNVIVQSFVDGRQYSSSKAYVGNVRAIRSF